MYVRAVWSATNKNGKKRRWIKSTYEKLSIEKKNKLLFDVTIQHIIIIVVVQQSLFVILWTDMNNNRAEF